MSGAQPSGRPSDQDSSEVADASTSASTSASASASASASRDSMSSSAIDAADQSSTSIMSMAGKRRRKKERSCLRVRIDAVDNEGKARPKKPCKACKGAAAAYWKAEQTKAGPPPKPPPACPHPPPPRRKRKPKEHIVKKLESLRSLGLQGPDSCPTGASDAGSASSVPPPLAGIAVPPQHPASDQPQLLQVSLAGRDAKDGVAAAGCDSAAPTLQSAQGHIASPDNKENENSASSAGKNAAGGSQGTAKQPLEQTLITSPVGRSRRSDSSIGSAPSEREIKREASRLRGRKSSKMLKKKRLSRESTDLGGCTVARKASSSLSDRSEKLKRQKSTHRTRSTPSVADGTTSGGVIPTAGASGTHNPPFVAPIAEADRSGFPADARLAVGGRPQSSEPQRCAHSVRPPGGRVDPSGRGESAGAQLSPLTVNAHSAASAEQSSSASGTGGSKVPALQPKQRPHADVAVGTEQSDNRTLGRSVAVEADMPAFKPLGGSGGGTHDVGCLASKSIANPENVGAAPKVDPSTDSAANPGRFRSAAAGAVSGDYEASESGSECSSDSDASSDSEDSSESEEESSDSDASDATSTSSYAGSDDSGGS